MLIKIENAHLKVMVDTLGAQLMSVLDKDGCEYLWQGDPGIWADRAPVLFPVIARLENKQYQLNGKIYSMNGHGFAAQAAFEPELRGDDTLVLTLNSTEATREMYPFDFTLEITYQLTGNTICIRNRVVNRGEQLMHFALGGHPGFCVPLNGEGCFEDYYLEFSQACSPDRLGFTADTILLNGQNCAYPLQHGTTLPLRHDLFDEDAVILQHMARQIALRSKSSSRSVTVAYPDMPYLGIWHRPHKAAPYVCIEPWSSLPGRSGVLEDISCRSDFIHLPAGLTWENTWTITVV